MKTLYVTDLDGTLLNENAELTDESRKLLNDAIDKGACFTVATARTFATVIDMFKGINLAFPLILMNGVMLYDPIKRKSVYSHSIDSVTARKVLDVFKNKNLSPLVYYDKGDCLEIQYDSFSNEYQMAYVNKRNHSQGKMFVHSPSLTISEEDKIIYFVILDLYENIIELYNELKSIENINVAFYKDNYTECHFLEIFAKGVSKASGLSDIKELTGAEKIIAFGDNLNDLDMFKSADESYAVSNACDELKKASTDIIGPNTDDSVAKFIFNHYLETLNG